MKYKAIVSDLDGTLLNSDGNVSDLNLSCISLLNDLGVCVVLATGRHPLDALLISSTLNQFANIVGLNGSLVIDKNGKVIIEHIIDKSCIQEILKIIEGDSVHLSVFDKHGWNIIEENKMVKEYSFLSAFPYEKIQHQDIENIDVNKLLLWKPENIKVIENKIMTSMKGKITCYRTSDHQLEIGPANVSKASTVSSLLAEKGIVFNQHAIAFGDALNDFAMLKQAAYGVIMDNAMQELKNALPTLPIAPSNDNNGVARLLKKIFNI